MQRFDIINKNNLLFLTDYVSIQFSTRYGLDNNGEKTIDLYIYAEVETENDTYCFVEISKPFITSVFELENSIKHSLIYIIHQLNFTFDNNQIEIPEDLDNIQEINEFIKLTTENYFN